MRSSSYIYCDIVTSRNSPEVVKEFRGRHGFSQTTLSKLTGIPQPVLSMYEHGRRSPSIDTLERILLDDPDHVIDFGRSRLRVLERSLGKRSSSYIETWRRLLDGPRSDIVRLLLSTGEHDVELLKMSPFTTLLNHNERDDVC